MINRYATAALFSSLALFSTTVRSQSRTDAGTTPIVRSAMAKGGHGVRSASATPIGNASGHHGLQARHTNAAHGGDAFRGGPPANDDCAGAIALTVSSAFTPIDGDVFGATQSLAAITCATFTGVADDDVWYSFVATTTNPKIRVVGNQYFDAVVDLRSGACTGSNIACADATLEGEAEQINATGLSIGATYYVRVYHYYDVVPTMTTFSIGVYTGALTPPANDQCGSVVAQSLSAGGSLSFSGNTSAATATNDYAVGSSWEGSLPSTWHAFTTTTCTNVTITYCGTSPAFEDIWIALNTGCPADDNYILASTYDFTTCGDGNATMTFTNLPADTYYLPVMAEGGNALGPYTIDVDATACGAAPVNDDCGSVSFTPLSAGGTITFSGDNTGASAAGDYVTGSILDQGLASVWHGFTTTTCVDLVVEYCGITPTWENAWIVLATSCPADDNLIFNTSFDITNCPDGNITIYYDDLPAGTYYFPVMNDPGLSAVGPYSIDLIASACGGGGTPVNDDCGSVSFTPLSAGSTITFSGDNTGATTTGDYVTGSLLDQGLASVWHGFTTTTCVNLVVEYCGIVPTWENAWVVLATSCPSDDNLIFNTTFDITSCPDGNITIFYDNLPAGTYYFPVMNDPGFFAVGPYSIDLTATACAGVGPANDDCAGAIEVDVELPADCPANAVTVDNTGATQDGPFNTCDLSGTLLDVWYTFNSLANTEVMIDLAPGTATDWVVAVFDACGGAEVFCFVNPVGPQIVAVTPGTDYVVQVYSNSDFGDPGTFTLCISGNFSSNVIEPAANAWNVYPNPSNGDITLAYAGATDNVRIELFDLTGRAVYTDRTRLVTGSTLSIHLAGQLAQGTYTMRLTGAQGSTEQRVVVQ